MIITFILFKKISFGSLMTHPTITT